MPFYKSSLFIFGFLVPNNKFSMDGWMDGKDLAGPIGREQPNTCNNVVLLSNTKGHLVLAVLYFKLAGHKS